MFGPTTHYRVPFLRLLAVCLLIQFSGPLMANAQQNHSNHDDHDAQEKKQHEHKKPAKLTKNPYTLATDPVSGEKLPERKKQVIIQHEGRELRFASDDTLKKFKAGPAKYIKKIDKQLIAQQLRHYPLDTCIVSGEKLGGDMGKPVNFLHNNRLIRFCCKSCKKDFLKKPATYLKPLDKVIIAKQKLRYPLKTCVVSGEELNSMGNPIDHVVGNRLVRFCCKRCVKTFNKEPAKYLAILDKAAKHQQKGDKHESGGHESDHGEHHSSDDGHKRKGHSDSDQQNHSGHDH